MNDKTAIDTQASVRLAKQDCPLSKALAGVPAITLKATLR